jgi:hypothetical protein
MTVPEFELSDDERYRLVGTELLRRGRARIDAAKAANDPTPLLDPDGKLLFAFLGTLMVDTDAMRAIVERGELSVVSNETFRAAIRETGASERDLVAWGARTLSKEAYEFVRAKRPDLREWISGDDLRNAIRNSDADEEEA